MRIPVRYILLANHVNSTNVAYSITTDTAICQIGTPNGILSIMPTGEVKGIIDIHRANELSGAAAMMDELTIGIIKSKEIGVTNCWVSVSLSTAAPTAANIAEYRK